MIKSAAIGVCLQVIPSVLAFFLFYQIDSENVNSNNIIPFYIVGIMNLIKGFGELGVVRSFTIIFAKENDKVNIFGFFLGAATIIFMFCEIFGFTAYYLNLISMPLSIILSLSLLVYYQLLDALLISIKKERTVYFIDSVFYVGFYSIGLVYFNDFNDSIYYDLISVYLLFFFVLKVFLCSYNGYQFKPLLPNKLSNKNKNEFFSNFKISINLITFKQVDRFVLLNIMPVYYVAFVNVFNQFFNKLFLFGTYYSRLMLVVFSEEKQKQNEITKGMLLFESYVFLIVFFGCLLKNNILDFFRIDNSVFEYQFVYVLLLMSVSYNVCARYYRAYISGNGDTKFLFKVDVLSLFFSLCVGGSFLYLSGKGYLYYLTPFIFFFMIYIGCFVYLRQNISIPVCNYSIIVGFNILRFFLCYIYLGY